MRTRTAPAGREFARSNALQARLHDLVPGGAHTYARGPDQYPEGMAPILVRGSGARVWDCDGNEYIEYGSGLRSVTLGHGYRPVVEAVTSAALDGVAFSRPTELEVLAAEDFLSLVPGADMVKFAKNGSDATTAAVRLARAVTGRSTVAVCDQPFFASDDWFIGVTPMNAGVPRQSTVRFRYNDAEALERLLIDHEIACVVLEPATTCAEPAHGYLESVRALCDRYGALLVFDEIVTGFRWSIGGAQGLYGVRPDLSCWGKAMGNGFPIAALAGRREFMEYGGLRTDRDRVFLLSTTHGPETTGLAAFRAVVRAYRSTDPIARMQAAGHELASAVGRTVAELGIEDYLTVVGRPSCLMFRTRDGDGTPSQEYRTLFLQELLRHGVLGQSFVTSAAHTELDIAQTAAACHAAATVYRTALERGSVDTLLTGRPVAPAIRRRAAPRRIDRSHG